MSVFVAIGNSPSSGSTLLADLIDSSPGAVCGPEVHLYTSRAYLTDDALLDPLPWYLRPKRLAETTRAQYRRFRSSPCASCYTTRVRLNLGELHSYGLDIAMVREFWRESSGFDGFCDRFFRHFAALRGKDARVFAEKTPQNIHAAKAFLDRFPSGVFVHVVRNPLDVFRSVRRRGFPPYVAAATWLVDVSAAYALREHPRFRTIRFEDLTASPFETVSSLLEAWGEEVEAAELEAEYSQNAYRRVFTRRPETWQRKEMGEVSPPDSATAPLSGTDLDCFSQLLRGRVGTAYADHFGLDISSFDTLARFYDYGPADWAAGLSGADAETPSKEMADEASRSMLLDKWKGDCHHGDAAEKDRSAFLRPLVPTESAD